MEETDRSLPGVVTFSSAMPNLIESRVILSEKEKRLLGGGNALPEQTLERFTEYKRTYFGEVKTFECSLAERSLDHLVITFEISQPMEFVNIRFEPGCVSYGYYWEDRDYNVYHWKDGYGRTLLYYFNIARDTRIGTNRVDWVDLIVDVAVRPDGRI